MKKHVFVTVAGVAALACVGWLSARHAGHVMLEKSIDGFRQTLGPDTSLTYQKAWPGLLGRSVKFTGLVFRQGQETITADEAEIAKINTTADDSRRIGHLAFHKVQLTDTAGNLHLDNLTLDDVTLPGNGETKHGPPSQALEIRHMHADTLHGFIASLQSDVTASSVTVDNFGKDEASHLEARDLRLATNVAPQRQITAKFLLLDGVDLAGSYASIANNTPYKPLNGVREVQVDTLSIDGTTPLLRVARLASHATHSAASEQEISSLQGLELWPAVPSLSALTELGYDHFRGSLLVNVTHDYKAGKLHVDTVSLEAPNMGRLTLDGDFSEASTLAMLSASAADVQVLNLNLSYTDHGLVPKVLEYLAKTHNMTVQDYMATLQTGLTIPHDNTPSASIQQFTSYLAHPDRGPLTISLHPQQPMPIMALVASMTMLPATPQIAQQIGLTVHAP